MKPLWLIILLAIGAAVNLTSCHPRQHSAESAAGEVAEYRCPMHPHIHSDKPGRCTICGMDLVLMNPSATQQGSESSAIELTPATEAIIGVGTAAVERRPLNRTIRVAGVIDDDDRLHQFISAYADGRIEKLHVNYTGAEVRAGEPLAEFYSPPILAARDEYLLLTRQGADPRAIAGAEQRLLRLGLTAEQVRDLPRKPPANSIEIVAPRTGTVITKDIYPGSYVKEGDRLFEISDFSNMWFVFDLYEQDLPWVKTGDKVKVRVTSLPGQNFEGTISFIEPTLNPATRAAKARVDLANPIGDGSRRLLSHQLYAAGEIETSTSEVLTIPRTAVLSAGDENVVYVQSAPNSYAQRAVKLGRAGEQSWEVLEGLQAGEVVVTEGNFLIDAQAQLTQTTRVPQRKGALDPSLNEPDPNAWPAAFSTAAALAGALAANDLSGFNARVPQWNDRAGTIDLPTVTTADDLAVARQNFQRLMQTLVPQALKLRRENSGFASLKIYECPMAPDEHGKEQTARWIQVQEPLANPFFGPEMLTCGTEVEE